ncbi:MAG: GDSL-type esterase/lipase family protein [Opitutaceae bacterium]|jgi:lysophospholipase L1-like esterase|nr:GDSL-type esterase/lipase family protein [Opitutaceae bacterium]|tara:strand:- start:270 stop:974 length:705 start_codon:yes stop_codon:yes gene_type:complete
MKFTLLLSLLIVLTTSLLAQRVNVIDYAKGAQYEAANAALPSVQKGEKRVVFMGDSITAAWAKKRPAFFVDNHYIGRGISGQVTHQMLLRFRAEVIDLKPQAVVILAGTNDIAQNSGPATLESVAGNIMSMAELAQQNDIIPILCSVLPAKDYPWRADKDPLTNIPKLNALIKAYANANKIPYVDYFSAMEDGQGGLKVPEYTAATDLVHPNETGFAAMERILKPIIDKALKHN